MTVDLTISAQPDQLWSEDAKRLPPSLYLGTSTWAFPEWKGILYRQEYRSERDFSQRCLAEYASVPWFRTVCIDSLFYNAPKPETLVRYAEQVPESFRWVSKVWERITIHTYPKHARYGALAGGVNPDFLNAELFSDRVLRTYETPEVRLRTGPLVFQFAPFSSAALNYERFLELLDNFLSKLPKGYEYAVEVRNRELLSRDYFQTLNRHGATHCFNHWNSMIPIREQMKCAAEAGGLSADFFVARLLTPLGLSYEGAAKLLEPYVALKRVNPAMRADAVRLARRAISTGKRAYVTANNKAEGNAPLTMVSLAQLIVASLEENAS